MSNSQKSKVGIIGAGPSGLAMSLFLNSSTQILEKAKNPGGHASSFLKEGFTFDYGPHIMFSKNQAVLEFMIQSLGANVQKCRRNNKISFKNKLIKYPFENDLKSLPPEDNFACLKGFVNNPYQAEYPHPKNMREWMLKTFGAGICDRYLFPYNEKVWNIAVEKLSMAWADRIPNPPSDDIIKSAIGFETEGYLHQLYYHYPKKGGYQAICEAWAKGADIQYGFNVRSIERTKQGGFIVSDGTDGLEYSGLVSTMPIQELVKCLRFSVPQEITDAINRLIVNPMIVVSIGIRGVDTDQFTAIYFPEADFLVNRLSYPCTFSQGNAPEGHYSVQAEITCLPDSKTWNLNDSEIRDHVRNGLLSRGLIKDPSQIIFEDVRRCSRSYVVYDVDYESNVMKIRKYFDDQNLHLVGRFSFFEYVNVDMAVERALKVSSRLNGDGQSQAPLLDHQALLDRALAKIS